jgi:hypothetical protein
LSANASWDSPFRSRRRRRTWPNFCFRWLTRIPGLEMPHSTRQAYARLHRMLSHSILCLTPTVLASGDARDQLPVSDLQQAVEGPDRGGRPHRNVPEVQGASPRPLRHPRASGQSDPSYPTPTAPHGASFISGPPHHTASGPTRSGGMSALYRTRRLRPITFRARRYVPILPKAVSDAPPPSGKPPSDGSHLDV